MVAPEDNLQKGAHEIWKQVVFWSFQHSIKNDLKKEYMKKITIKWGTDKDKTKSYTFKNEEEAKFFMMGVDEGNGWLEYEVVSGWFDK